MHRIIPAALAAVLLGFTPARSEAPQYTVEQYLNIRSAWGGRFMPDRDQVLFLSDLTGEAQVYLVSAQGGWPRQLTFFRDGATGATVSPDGLHILVSADAGGNECDQFYLTSPLGEAPVRVTPSDSAIYTFGGWSDDNTRFAFTSNERDPRFFDVYIHEIDRGESRLIYQRDSWLSCMGWLPGDRFLMVSDDRSREGLIVVDVETGGDRLLTQFEQRGAPEAPEGSGDGAVADPQAGSRGTVVSADGRLMVHAATVDGYTELKITDLPQGLDIPPPPLPPGQYSDLAFSRDNTRMIFTYSSPQQNSDVWIYHLDRAELTRVTRSGMAGIDPASLVRPLAVEYPSFDGLMIPGLLYLPHGAQPGDSLPTVVKMHGGPASQSLPCLSPVVQYFVHRGIAVFEPNVRGSAGFGREYSRLDDREKRLDAVRDMEYATYWLVEQGWSHPQRLGIMGDSYGGYMVLAALTEQPDLWACGVDIVGIANFVTFLERTGPWRRASREAEYGSLETHRDLLTAISPIHKVDRVQAPLLVVQGANDPRVPVSEAEQIVKALKRRGRPVEYLLYPDEGHGFTKLSNMLDAYPKIAAFMLENIATGRPAGQ